MKRVDLFCYKHPRFGINNLMMIICIGNIAVWLFSAMDTTGMLRELLAFSPYHILRGQIWRLVTFVFLPLYSSPFSLLISLYFYYFIGSTLERQWGAGRFTIYYLCGMLLQVVYGFIIYFVRGISYSMTANYINLSMFFAFATLYPDNVVLLFFIIPIKVKWLAWADAALFAVDILGSLFRLDFLGALLPVIALLNFLVFFWSDLTGTIRYHRSRARHQNSYQTIHFKSAVKQQEKKAREQGYHHKCCVCGRTDTEYPNLQFRYCSRCAGYHCFCEDHIFNHVHFTE